MSGEDVRGSEASGPTGPGSTTPGPDLPGPDLPGPDALGRPRLRAWHAEATGESVERMREILAAGDVLVPVRSPVTRPSQDENPTPASPLPAASVIIRTSGSTGAPRHIVIPPEAFEASARASAARLDLRPDDVWWASLSPAHVGGIALLLRAETLGCGVELTGGFDAAVFWDLCAAGRITHASLVPTMLRRILEARPAQADVSALRAILIGGAAAAPELLERAIDAGLPVTTTWGMTETASQVATSTPTRTAADPTHAGHPLDGVDVRVDDDGRLVVRTPTMALGELVDGRLVPLADDDGWYVTDDLGWVGDDGLVRITGRVSDRIISGGVNVDPLEVEREILALDWVDHVAVVGVPDAEWGERVVAAVVVREGVDAPPDALLDRLPATLDGARRPKEIFPLAALPLNRNGKVDRTEVRTRVRTPGAS